MLRIISHIERLLLVHDCVIVPKFGGFVLQSIPAQQVEMYTFRPSRKELRFNVTLPFADVCAVKYANVLLTFNVMISAIATKERQMVLKFLLFFIIPYLP